jgi:predicted Zn-dependent protease with MMP-like domain
MSMDNFDEISEEMFREFVNEAYEELPDQFKKDLKNVEIIVQDMPDQEQTETLRLRRYDRLFGLYTGVPQTVPGEDRATLPDRVYLFRLPIIRSFDTEDEVRQQVKDTLYHEIGHYFGIEEAKLRKLQRRRVS